MNKKITVWLLILTMIFTMLPATALAAEYPSEELSTADSEWPSDPPGDVRSEDTVKDADGNVDVIMSEEETDVFVAASSDGASPYNEEAPQTEPGAYLISSEAQLIALADTVNDGTTSYKNSTFVLENEIELSGAWTPIGTKEHCFSGAFDGNEKTVTINVNGDPGQYSGFFGYASDATIQNLTVAGTVTGDSLDSSYTGGIVGYCVDTVLYNCINQAKLSVHNQTGLIPGLAFPVVVGGIAGGIENCTVDSCKNESDNGLLCFGGVIGNINRSSGVSLIINCENNGSFSLETDGPCAVIGGIIGTLFSKADVIGCRNSGELTAISSTSAADGAEVKVGGIAAYSYESGAIFENCVNTGTLSAEAQSWSDKSGVGGIVGNANAKFTAANSYNAGNLAMTGNNAQNLGALFGRGNMNWSSQPLSVDCYGLADQKSNRNESDGLEWGSTFTSKSAAELKSEEFLTLLNGYYTGISSYNASWIAGPDGYPAVNSYTRPNQISAIYVGGLEPTSIDHTTGKIFVQIPEIFAPFYDLSSLECQIVPSIGATVDQENGVYDFTDSEANPLEFTVTSADGTKRTYYVTVTVELSRLKITSFKVGSAEGIIDDLWKTIDVTLPVGTDLYTGFTPVIEWTEGASCTSDGVASDGVVRLSETNILWYNLEDGEELTSYQVTFHTSLKGEGAEEDPFLVESASDLYAVSFLNGGTEDRYFRQTTDLDFAGLKFLGVSMDGIYDGAGFHIKNLVMGSKGYSATGNNVALFPEVKGTIKNVTTDATCSFENFHNVGAIVGWLCGGSVIDCVNYAPVTCTMNQTDGLNLIAGGVVGWATPAYGFVTKSCLISGCVNYGTVSYRFKTPGGAGGIAGSASSFTDKVTTWIVDCRNYGIVDASTTADGSWDGKSGGWAGGIAGSASGGYCRIVGCSNQGAVTAGSASGGIAGRVQGGIVESCFNVGTIKAANMASDQTVGGVVGRYDFYGMGAFIANCYSTGKLEGVPSTGGTYRGGVTGKAMGPLTIAGCYYDENAWIDVGGLAKDNEGKDYIVTSTAVKLSLAAMKESEFVARLNTYGEPVTRYGVAFAADTGNQNGGYPVMVSVAQIKNYDVLITKFSIGNRDGVIDQVAGTISITLPSGTDVTALEPDITVSDGAAVSPGGLQDFSQPVTYTVTAENGVKTKQYVVAAAVPQNGNGLVFLTLEANGAALALSPAFSQDVTDYTVTVTDVQLLGAPNSYELVATCVPADGIAESSGTFWSKGADYKNHWAGKTSLYWYEDYDKMIQPGDNLLRLQCNGRDYAVNLHVIPTLKSLSFSANGAPLAMTSQGDGWMVDVPVGVTVVTADAMKQMSGATITYNGSDASTIDISSLEEFNIVVSGNGASKTYPIKLNKLGASVVTFKIAPVAATVVVYDKNGATVSANSDDTYTLVSGAGYDYTYVVSFNGYMTKRGTLTVSELKNAEITLNISLDKAAKGDLPSYTGDWTSFRGNPQNMATVAAKTPTSQDTAKLLWAVKGGSGWSNAPTPPLLVNGNLYLQSGGSVFCANPATGEVLASAATAGSAGYATNPVAYGEGMIFVLLDDGRVQAFRADTLKSLWISEAIGGQTLSPITYHNGYVYTGTWNSEEANGTYFCLSVTDEDPAKTSETKYATWKLDHKGGFYWAGAYATDDYVVFGSDDGDLSYDSPTATIYSVNPTTGKVLDTVTGVKGDIRACISATSDGYVFFTTKGGTFGRIKLNNDGTFDDSTYKAFDMGQMSTGTPVVYNGVAFVSCASSEGQFAEKGNVFAVDVKTMTQLALTETPGYAQASMLLSTAYSGSGKLYLYATYNHEPGGLYVMTYDIDGKSFSGADLFRPTGNHAQYNISAPVCDASGTIYFKNDSGYLFAVGRNLELESISANASGARTEYKVGERFDPVGLIVTAHFKDGSSGTVTRYTVPDTPFAAPGPQSVTITYSADGITKTAAIDVMVSEATLSGLTIKAKPDKLSYTEGDSFDPSGMIVSAIFSDGTEAIIHGYKLSHTSALSAGMKVITVSYTVGEITKSVDLAIAVTAKPVGPAANIKVSFRLIGATRSKGSIDLKNGDYKGSKYVTWIATKKYNMNQGNTVYDLFVTALAQARLESIGAEANYVKTIKAPASLGGYELSEFTNGRRSGWMYTVNGRHPNEGLQRWNLKDGDKVIWHYVNDYSYEVADWFDDHEYPALGDGTYFDKWLEAEDVDPSGLPIESGNGSSTILAPTATASNGVVIVTMSASDLAKAIEDVKTNDNTSIVIAPEISGTVKTISIELPKASVSSIASSTKAELTVKTPIGNLTIPNDLLAPIVSQATGNSITLRIDMMEKDALTAEQQKAIGTGMVYDISVLSGSAKITSFGDKAITISLPYTLKAGETAEGVTVWYLNDKGELEKMACKYDKTTKLATFTTNHLSKYLVGYTEAWKNPFTDVKSEAWYYSAVEYAVKNGLFNGTTATTFSPSSQMTRAMLVTVLYRMDPAAKPVTTSGSAVTGGTLSKPEASSFTDVKSGQWYTDAILWANEKGIVSGIGNGLFGTNNNVTREQMATILYNYAKYKGYDTAKMAELKAFTDASAVSAWAQPAMKWTNAEGLVTGRTAATLAPKGNASRAEVATILKRFAEGTAK